jgi:hypothetical protein
MKRTILLFLMIVFILMFCQGQAVFAGAAKAAEEKPEDSVIRRFAVVVGANDGGKDRVKLRYAVSDAKAILDVLENLGGVSPDDSRLLIEPSREALFWAIDRLKDRIIRARITHRRVEAIFYYSGHSDEEHLLMGKEKISYREFRDAIDGIDTDVRIAILDSCASGAFTRLKGGKKKPPFLVDSAYDMKGYAVMTSSSSDESSQESDRLKGSFFTHFLNSGLRGAADMNGDGRITLSEAYQFAFNETLQQTEKTLSGPQHPNYDIRMSGTGDVIITDIRKSDTILRLGKDISGKLFIHDSSQVLVVELNKAAGRVIELGLDQGKYRIIIINDDSVYEHRVKLAMGKTVEVHFDQFNKSDKLDTVARGDLKYRERMRVFKKRGKKANFFFSYNQKFTRAQGKTAWLTGGQLGITFNKSLSLGIAGYSDSDLIPLLNNVSYGGLTLEYALPSRSFYNLKAGCLIGDGKEGLFGHRFFIFEPEFVVTLNITRLLNISSGISFRFTSTEDVSLSPLSWMLSIRLGK